jgi:hypothetical protein
MRVSKIVVAGRGPVLHRRLEYCCRGCWLCQGCQVSTVPLLFGNLLGELLILREEALGLVSHAGRCLRVPVILVHLLLDHALVSSYLVSVQLLCINLFDPVMLVDLAKLSISVDVLILIFLRCPRVLRMHRINAAHDSRQWSLSVHAA